MFKKIKNILYLIFFFAFIILTTTFYFSDKNIKLVNKSRAFYSFKLNNVAENLPLLKDDTDNIIEYKNDLKTFKGDKKKYKFWDLLKPNK